MSLKILMLETGGWGGISHYTYNLSEAISKVKNLEVILLTDSNYELENFQRNFRIIKTSIHDQNYFKTVIRIIKTIFIIKPSIIHIQSLISPRKDWIFFLIARILGISIVYTVHNIIPHEEAEINSIGLKKSLHTIYKSSQRLIVHSQSNLKEMINIFGIEPQKISVIPHGNYLFVLPHKIMTKEDARSVLGLNLSDKVILFFGAIRKYKGIDYLIKAFKKVLKRIPHTKLLIAGKPMGVGEASPIDGYRGLVRELQLQEKVIFDTAYILLSDIQKFFVASDVVIFPYLDTTESGSLQLAFAFAKSIIATRVGSFEEAIEQHKNGLLVPPRNDGALAEAIIKILSLDERALNEMGKYSKFLAETKYNWNDIAKKTIKVYRSLA